MTSELPCISIVTPAYNEGQHLFDFVIHLDEVLTPIRTRYQFELILIDDGSKDDTYKVIQTLAQQFSWIHGIRFSRNFGKEAALLAGLRYAKGSACITIDADLEHPPSLIPALIEQWNKGSQIVSAVKSTRGQRGHSSYHWIAKLVTRSISRLTGLPLHNASDYKLLDRQVVNVLINDLRERERFFRGLTAWVGFRHQEITFDVAEGTRPDRRWTISGLMRLSLTALIAFTSAPIHLITILGAITLIFSMVVGGEALDSYFQGTSAHTGVLTILFTLLILGSFIMISLGIIGTYIAKIYEEIKQRPIYLIEQSTDGVQ